MFYSIFTLTDTFNAVGGLQNELVPVITYATAAVKNCSFFSLKGSKPKKQLVMVLLLVLKFH